MEWAINARNERIKARRHIIAFCPGCGKNVIAKCGNIKVHHWAHESGIDCDPWWEPETPWHRYWKNLVPKKQQEVTIANHRADIVRKDGMVVELQHSSISSEDIIAREKCYGNMIWLFDGRHFSEKYDRTLHCETPGWPVTKSGRFQVWEKYNPNYDQTYFTFRWSRPKTTLQFCKKPIIIDMGLFVFWIRELFIGFEYRGWGQLQRHDDFKVWLKGKGEIQNDRRIICAYGEVREWEDHRGIYL